MQYILHDLIRLPLSERLKIIDQVLNADPTTTLISDTLNDVLKQHSHNEDDMLVISGSSV